MAIPSHAKYVIIGAGIHGLSTAFHLAQELTSRGTGSGQDILVVDKSGICAGATGIACGVIRNNYYQPAMRELMAHSVKIWESDPDTYSYHPVGYMQISCESMHEDIASIYQQQDTSLCKASVLADDYFSASPWDLSAAPVLLPNIWVLGIIAVAVMFTSL